MNKVLGFSIYPHLSTIKKDKEYIDLAVKYNFKRLFTCLLSVGADNQEAFNNFKEIIKYARSKNLEVFFDIDTSIFREYNISSADLFWFKELQATGIRLDSGFEGLEVANQSFNKYDLLVELNISNDTYYLENILSYMPNKHNLIACHNFYPQRYTGLSYDNFISCSKRYKKFGLRTATFVTSQTAKIGPWDINDRLCTLEHH